MGIDGGGVQANELSNQLPKRRGFSLLERISQNERRLLSGKKEKKPEHTDGRKQQTTRNEMFQQGGNSGQAYQPVQDQGHYGQAPAQKQYGQYDPEMGYGKPAEDGGSYAAFMEKEVRRGFIRKVFSILAVQLFVTFGFAIMMSTNSHVKAYCTGNIWPFYASIPLVIGSLIGLSCCGNLHRKFPHNYGLLAAFTIGESYGWNGDFVLRNNDCLAGPPRHGSPHHGARSLCFPD